MYFLKSNTLIFLRTGIELPKSGKKGSIIRPSRRMAPDFTAKIHHEKAVKKDGEGKYPEKSILKNLFPNKKP